MQTGWMTGGTALAHGFLHARAHAGHGLGVRAPRCEDLISGRHSDDDLTIHGDVAGVPKRAHQQKARRECVLARETVDAVHVLALDQCESRFHVPHGDMSSALSGSKT
jgi:hypothetical protein